MSISFPFMGFESWLLKNVQNKDILGIYFQCAICLVFCETHLRIFSRFEGETIHSQWVVFLNWYSIRILRYSLVSLTTIEQIWHGKNRQFKTNVVRFWRTFKRILSHIFYQWKEAKPTLSRSTNIIYIFQILSKLCSMEDGYPKIARS